VYVYGKGFIRKVKPKRKYTAKKGQAKQWSNFTKAIAVANHIPRHTEVLYVVAHFGVPK
jgi:hypothetical protein